MKSLVKLALCGVIAAAMGSGANAAVTQLATNAPELMASTRVGRLWLQENLKIASGVTPTLEALNAAIGKLAPAQAAAAVNAINAYASKAVNAGTNIALKSNNEQLAKTLFQTSNGQVLQIAAMVTTAATHENVTNAVAGPTCSIDQIASALAEGTKVPFAIAKEVVDSGALSLGDCAHSLISINREARENALKIGEYKLRHCSKDGKVATGTAGEACLIGGTAEVLHITAAKAASSIKMIGEECHYFN